MRSEEEDDRKLKRKYGESSGGSRKGKDSRKRKRSTSDSSSSEDTALKMQVRTLTEKLKDMEGSRKWNSRSNEMQYLHCVKVRQVLVEDYRDLLEERFGDWKKILPTIFFHYELRLQKLR